MQLSQDSKLPCPLAFQVQPTDDLTANVSWRAGANLVARVHNESVGEVTHRHVVGHVNRFRLQNQRQMKTINIRIMSLHSCCWKCVLMNSKVAVKNYVAIQPNKISQGLQRLHTKWYELSLFSVTTTFRNDKKTQRQNLTPSCNTAARASAKRVVNLHCVLM